MTAEELQLRDCDGFMEAYLNQHFPWCPACGRRIPPTERDEHGGSSDREGLAAPGRTLGLGTRQVGPVPR